MTTYTYSDELFSDLHKDTHGFRPRDHEFYHVAPARKQEIWDSLIESFEDEVECERQAQIEAQRKLETLISQTMELGAEDRETALRWILDAEVDDFDVWYGSSYICHSFGLAYCMQWMFDDYVTARKAVTVHPLDRAAAC